MGWGCKEKEGERQTGARVICLGTGDRRREEHRDPWLWTLEKFPTGNSL